MARTTSDEMRASEEVRQIRPGAAATATGTRGAAAPGLCQVVAMRQIAYVALPSAAGVACRREVYQESLNNTEGNLNLKN